MNEEEFIDDGEEGPIKKKKPENVEISIRDRDEETGELIRYSPGTYGGKEHISVWASGRTYGSASPCDNEEEVQSSVEHAKKMICDHGDKPVVKDYREKATLKRWF